ncbi:ABC transporter substrate-binding protein [Spiroplasma turonicum]|uniref:Oligopeptide ABC transporter substrate-binding protein n=1 Tax=Spiroplasma turonicum TaxID=216946 RepID=A0A0K1P5D4_9MOLU|nr:ABC transporter substrate-binding protein [Spiroplasma turonicum]AKU79488.1 oligopeptide ABC transporter substrate-binding protein [Spiroplasma turonicum]ALX70509.1 oligopeptide ABC transporter substrate-binding protein [Spiroplasma turonicum]
MSRVFKKVLSFFSLSAISSIVASSTISCGISLDYLMNREIDETVYKDTYSYNVSSWNTAHTMQSSDSIFLANTFETLLSSDQYGRLYGALVESEYGANNHDNKNNIYNYVGVHNDDYTKWTYKFRENLNWVSADGEVGRKILPSDILKAAKYALIPGNASDVSSLYTSFIVGAEDIFDKIGELETNSNTTQSDIDEVFNDAIENKKFGIIPDDNNNTVTFELIQKAPFFESLLTYSVFSPIYDETKSDIKNYKDTYFSGAYLPKQVNPNGKVILEKNENYVLKDDVHIKRLEFDYLEGASSSRTRTLFESGSTNGFILSADDLKGWTDYVGDNYENPIFEGTYSTKSVELAGTFVLFYNYYNRNLNDASKGVEEQKRALNATKLLQSRDVRAFLSTSLDRSKMVRYYSKTIDEVGKPSKMIRNVYTGLGVSQDPTNDNKDYTKFVSDVYDERTNTIKESEDNYSLKDGNDPLLDNSKKLIKKDRSELINSINKFISENNIASNRDDGKIELTLTLSPVTSNSMNPYINFMIKGFNSIENNPIFIKTTTPTSTDDYRGIGQEGRTDLFMSGWSPDYKDPSTYLDTLLINGAYKGYIGTTRIFDKTKSNDSNYEQLNGSEYYINKKIITTESNSMFEEYKNFETQNSENNQEVVITKRLEGFAKQEYDYFYKNFFMLPLYTKAMPIQYIVNYIQPYSRSYESFGTAQFKFYKAYQNKKLLNKEQIKEFMEKYNQALNKVNKDWNSCRYGAEWNDGNNENNNCLK